MTKWVKGIYEKLFKYAEEQEMKSQDPTEIVFQPSVVFIERLIVDYRVVLDKQTMAEVYKLQAINDLQKATIRNLCGIIDGMKKQGAKPIPSFTKELAEELDRVRQGKSPKKCICTREPLCPEHGIDSGSFKKYQTI